ncbi:hypothetical protein PMIN02_010515 [Paraphaeosphaeria minitans]|uniref:Uncharacterized protein n=1 Tax=Paraphaeosphaeria minitans TaxID=565426 RepID=A0A9P6GUU7_9PLEO|nr:hypothetical protein PMIN01_01380 [Paraphaeosphaeria minitans]
MLPTLVVLLTATLAAHAAPNPLLPSILKSRHPTSFAPCEQAITNCLRQEAGIVKCECKQGALVVCKAIGIPLEDARTEDLTFYRWERLKECPRHGHLKQCNMGRCVE